MGDMRTLSEIVEAALGNQPLEIEEARYALCAMSGLAAFDTYDLSEMAMAEKEGKPVRADQRYTESFNRRKSAYGVSPKHWLGPKSDPASADYQHQRKILNRIFQAALDGKLPNQTPPEKQ